MDHEIEISKPSFFRITRKKIHLLLLASLFIPFMIFAGHVAVQGVQNILMPLLLAICCSIAGSWYLLQLWEKRMQQSVNQLVLSRIKDVQKEPADSLLAGWNLEELNLKGQWESSSLKDKEEVRQLNLEMDRKLEEIRLAYLEFEDLRQEYHRLSEEATYTQAELQKNIDHKDLLISEYQRTISEQRMIIEKRQSYITKLENKVRELTHEIRALLQPEVSQINNTIPFASDEFETPYLYPNTLSQGSYDCSLLLQKYIKKAEALTGVDHLGYLDGKSPRFLDLSLDGYALDRRRLFDSFKDESAGALFIYDPSEKKMLFVNPAIKILTGLSPEKFIKDYPRLIIKGYPEWLELVSKLKAMKIGSLRLSVSHKIEQSMSLNCYVGMVLKGPFTNHIIGILYPER